MSTKKHVGKFYDESEDCNAWKYGMSIHEIAIIMNTTEYTVRTILYRALKKVKPKLIKAGFF